MRAFMPLAALAALAFAQTALAQTAAAETVTIGPVAFSPEFEESLREELGEREGLYLQNEIARQVARELAEAGAALGPNGALTLEITLIDADPNKPTLEQLSDRPGLDYSRSISVGGAELRGVLRNANGQVLAEIDHEYNSVDLFQAATFALTTWQDAQRAIRGFARKAADAYAAQAAAG